MNVNILPTYRCNLRCSFCYLGEAQLSSRKKLEINKLHKMLSQLESIDRIEIFGGEISLLPDDYILSLFSLINKEFYVLLNGMKIPWWIDMPQINLGFSYDYTCREDHKKVEQNLLKVEKPFAISMVATECILSKDHREIINSINQFPAVHSFEIKPYLPNEFNHQKISHTKYESFIKKMIQDRDLLKVPFYNEQILQRAFLPKEEGSTVFITPDAKWGEIDFLPSGAEYMKEFDTLEERNRFVEQRALLFNTNKYCSSCKYNGKCASEQQPVLSMEDSCFGHYNLIEWYAARQTRDHQHSFNAFNEQRDMGL